MWTELFLDNADNLVEELDSVVEQLRIYREALASHDEETLKALIEEGSVAEIEGRRSLCGCRGDHVSIVHIEASTPYDVLIDECTLDEVGELTRRVSGGDAAFVVSDTHVAPLYLDRVMESLLEAGYRTSSFVFEAGEAALRRFRRMRRCQSAMAEAGLTRSSVVVALGGGVVGDLAGFAAATYMRGCSCIQVPTSLLSCVDSSVGGKTAVDLPEGKNLVGAFFQPDAVLIDTSLLETLPHHFFTDGCAEVLKYGAIADEALFSLLEKPLVARDSRLKEVIRRCVEIKRDIVQEDEFEQGRRKLLNFGHTLGHAIERCSNFEITHGYAVACGMALVARACSIRGLLRRIERRSPVCRPALLRFFL